MNLPGLLNKTTPWWPITRAFVRLTPYIIGLALVCLVPPGGTVMAVLFGVAFIAICVGAVLAFLRLAGDPPDYS